MATMLDGRRGPVSGEAGRPKPGGGLTSRRSVVHTKPHCSFGPNLPITFRRRARSAPRESEHRHPYARRLGIPRLRKVYVTALVLIAVLSIGQQVGVELAVRRVRSDGIVVNRAARQHALSQAIAKSAFRASEAQSRASATTNCAISRGVRAVRKVAERADEGQRLPWPERQALGRGWRKSSNPWDPRSPRMWTPSGSSRLGPGEGRGDKRREAPQAPPQPVVHLQHEDGAHRRGLRQGKRGEAHPGAMVPDRLGAGTLGMIVVVGMFAFRPSIDALRETAAELEASHMKLEERNEAARQSEARFRRLGEAPTGIALVGPDGTWQRVNRSLRRCRPARKTSSPKA